MMITEEEFDKDDAFDALDELDYGDEEYENSLLRWMSIGFVICAVGGFVALAWYAYQNSIQPISEEEIPLVEAEERPFKEVPEDPGGWQFDHQDKSVYNQLAGGEEKERPVAERLLPAPEEPVQRPPVEELLANGLSPEPVREAQPGGEVVLAPTDSKPSQPVQEDAEPAPEPETEIETEQLVETKPAATPTDKPAAPAVTPAPAKTQPVQTTPGQFLVQLGSFRANADAEAAWSRIAKAHSARLSGHGHVVERADLGAKGVYYRLQYGPFNDDATAKNICEYLQQNKQACLVVKVK